MSPLTQENSNIYVLRLRQLLGFVVTQNTSSKSAHNFIIYATFMSSRQKSGSRKESHIDPDFHRDDNLTIEIIVNKMNEGKGAALKAGFAKATGDILMVQDADEEYSVKDYPALLSPFINEMVDVVYGSRNKLRKAFHTRYSYFSFYMGGIFLTWIVNFLYKTTLSDQATGYKLFSQKIKKILLQPSENGFSYEVAVTALISKSKYVIKEVPIHYSPRSMKEGKKINALDFVKSVITALKYI